jgi:hypothetical protein
MGKGLLIMIVGTLSTMMFVSTTFMRTTYSGVENSMSYFENIYTRNMANSMVNMLLTRLADSMEYRIDDGSTMEYFDGKVLEYKIIDTALDRRRILEKKEMDEDVQNNADGDKFIYEIIGVDTVIKIYAKVEYNGHINSVTAFTLQNRAGGWIPPVVRGAWTANGDLNNTISDMYIDGRNHDLNLNIVPNTGTRAISTSVDFRNEENAAIGGTAVDSTDYLMTFPERPEVIEEHYLWDGTFPETPDEILGYPEGTLKKLAQSGEYGSQYVLDPSEDIEDDLVFPLSGITFIEVTDDDERQLVLDGTKGQNSGVLVIHGEGRIARLKGLKMDDGTKKKKIKDGDPILFCHNPGVDQITMSTDNSDTLTFHLDHGDQLDDCPEIDDARFTGLIVTDYSFHHHLDILGAVLQLSPDLEDSKNCNGNKDHWVYYSDQAIRDATEVTAVLSRLIGNSDTRVYDVEGFGPGRQKVSHYYE